MNAGALLCSAVFWAGICLAQPLPPDISLYPADLAVPPMTDGKPEPGKRVRHCLPEYIGTGVYHTLYLPTGWGKGRRYPVIVEYAGNGPYKNRFGDVSTGRPEGSSFGFGMSGGEGFIWVGMPYVNSEKMEVQTSWWGDVDATLQYCRRAVRRVCEDFGGDPSAVFLTGFSRGGYACNFLGLHDDEIADIWLAFIPYSGYDGQFAINREPIDKEAVLQRFRRIRGRASFVCNEGAAGIFDKRDYIRSLGGDAPFLFVPTGFRNHNDAWTLRDSPARALLRNWVAWVLETRPGTHSISGWVSDPEGNPVAQVRIQSAYNHFTFTGDDGRYVLAGLVDGVRTVAAWKDLCVVRDPERQVTLNGADVAGLDFVASRRVR